MPSPHLVGHQGKVEENGTVFRIGRQRSEFLNCSKWRESLVDRDGEFCPTLHQLLPDVVRLSITSISIHQLDTVEVFHFGNKPLALSTGIIKAKAGPRLLQQAHTQSLTESYPMVSLQCIKDARWGIPRVVEAQLKLQIISSQILHHAYLIVCHLMPL